MSLWRNENSPILVLHYNTHSTNGVSWGRGYQFVESKFDVGIFGNLFLKTTFVFAVPFGGTEIIYFSLNPKYA